MLPLDQVHREAGAFFMTLQGRDIPAHYGDVDAEYRAVCESAGLIDRSLRGKVRATGKDRSRFLHGMVTNTIAGLTEGAGNYSAVTNAQGYMLLDVWVHHLGDFLWLETEAGGSQKLCETLNRFLIADDVTLTEETNQWAIIGVHGLAAQTVVRKAIGDIGSEWIENHTVIRSLGDVPVFVTARSFAGFSGVDLRIAASDAEPLWHILLKAGGVPVGWQAAEILRIESGIPRCGIDMDETVSPLEVGLSHAVDFNKGCYIGQEAIAKMHFRGKPRRYLVALHITGNTPPAVGSDVRVGDQKVGRITSSAFSPRLSRPVVLAQVRRGFETSGQEVLVMAECPATVMVLPAVLTD